MRHYDSLDGETKHSLSILDRLTMGYKSVECSVCGKSFRLERSLLNDALIIILSPLYAISELLSMTRPLSPSYLIYSVTGSYAVGIFGSFMFACAIGSVLYSYTTGIKES